MSKPVVFTKTFMRNAIASGALVPPPGIRASAGERLIAGAGWIVTALGVVAVLVAYWIEKA